MSLPHLESTHTDVVLRYTNVTDRHSTVIMRFLTKRDDDRQNRYCTSVHVLHRENGELIISLTLRENVSPTTVTEAIEHICANHDTSMSGVEG